jgi:hypothetical protein
VAEEGIKKKCRGIRGAIYIRRVGTQRDVGGSAGGVLDSGAARRGRLGNATLAHLSR